jgi:hypothetical protein
MGLQNLDVRGTSGQLLDWAGSDVWIGGPVSRHTFNYQSGKRLTMTTWQATLEGCTGLFPSTGVLVFTLITTTVAGMLIALYRNIANQKWYLSDLTYERTRLPGSLRSTAVLLMTTSAAGAGAITFSALAVTITTGAPVVSTFISMAFGLAFGQMVGHVAFLAGRADMLKIRWTPFDLFDSENEFRFDSENEFRE